MEYYMTNQNAVLETIKKAILEDEKEYCFDRGYTSDEQWVKDNGTETREEAYAKVQTWVATVTLDEVERVYGDKYDYLA